MHLGTQSQPNYFIACIKSNKRRVLFSIKFRDLVARDPSIISILY